MVRLIPEAKSHHVRPRRYAPLLYHYQFICLLQELRWNWAIQLPGDIHGAGTCVAHIAGSPQIGIRFRATSDPVRLEFPDEQQHLAAPFPVMDIPLSSCGILSCRALALPVEQAFVDGIVVIHGRWRIVLVSLIERHKEYIQLLLGQPLYTLTDSGRLQKI